MQRPQLSRHEFAALSDSHCGDDGRHADGRRLRTGNNVLKGVEGGGGGSWIDMDKIDASQKVCSLLLTS